MKWNAAVPKRHTTCQSGPSLRGEGRGYWLRAEGEGAQGKGKTLVRLL